MAEIGLVNGEAGVVLSANNSAQNLKPYVNQVAGHRFEEGRQGSLVDESGKFYKPLQGKDRGDVETDFYQDFWANEAVSEYARMFFPKFFGIVTVDQVKYAVMEDVTHGYDKPCVMDIKLGRKTWYEGAPKDYIEKCIEKDASTTSGQIGLRIAGMQVYEPHSGKTWKADRKWCKRIDVQGVLPALQRYVSRSPFSDAVVVDQNIASEVYGSVQSQLQQLLTWFSMQAFYHFYSSSVLIIYEGNPASPDSRKPKVKLVDFAHVIPGNGLTDSNMIQALESTLSFLSEVCG